MRVGASKSTYAAGQRPPPQPSGERLQVRSAHRVAAPVGAEPSSDDALLVVLGVRRRQRGRRRRRTRARSGGAGRRSSSMAHVHKRAQDPRRASSARDLLPARAVCRRSVPASVRAHQLGQVRVVVRRRAGDRARRVGEQRLDQPLRLRRRRGHDASDAGRAARPNCRWSQHGSRKRQAASSSAYSKAPISPRPQPLDVLGRRRAEQLRLSARRPADERAAGRSGRTVRPGLCARMPDGPLTQASSASPNVGAMIAIAMRRPAGPAGRPGRAHAGRCSAPPPPSCRRHGQPSSEPGVPVARRRLLVRQRRPAAACSASPAQRARRLHRLPAPRAAARRARRLSSAASGVHLDATERAVRLAVCHWASGRAAAQSARPRRRDTVPVHRRTAS